MTGLRLGLGLLVVGLSASAALALLLKDPSVSSPGIAGTKNGSVTWTGATGGPYLNPWTGQLLNTNLCLYSQDFSNAAWTKTNVTLTPQTAETMAPDGTQTAAKILATAGAATALSQNITATSTSHTESWFVKQGSGATDANRFRLRNLTTATSLLAVTVNLTTGAIAYTVGTAGATAIDVGGGWWRVTLTVESGVTVGNTLQTYGGFDSTAESANEFAYVWGSQFELGNVATPYVPTLAAAAGHPCYVRRAFPGFTVPAIPAVVGSALDRPFRHDFRHGQNMLVNSAWDGAVAGTPGTAPTSWSNGTTGTGAISAVGSRGSITFNCPALNDRRFQTQVIALAANTTYALSVVVEAASQPLRINELLLWTALPAGAAMSSNALRNGATVAASDTAVAGDTIVIFATVAGTAGNGTARVGLSTGGVVSPVSSVTLCCPQVEPGTIRSVYTPTTTAAINAIVCEPVRASEPGVYVEWHAQGARTNLNNGTTTNSGLASNTLTGLNRTLVENAANTSHFSSRALTVADGTTYSISFIASYSAAARNAGLYIGNGGGTIRGYVSANLATGVLTDSAIGGAVITSPLMTPLGAGRWKVSFNLTCAAWGAGIVIITGMSTSTSYANTYQGDGVSGITFEAVTLEAATFPGLPLGEGVTRAADNLFWTCAAPLSTVAGEIVAVARPYAWSAAAGANTPATVMQYAFRSSGATMYRQNTNDIVGRSDGAGQSASSPALSDDSGTSRMVTEVYSAASLDIYQGAVKKASDSALSPPWVGVPALSIASNVTPANHYHGSVALFVKDIVTFTEGERALLANALDGKTQAVYA